MELNAFRRQALIISWNNTMSYTAAIGNKIMIAPIYENSKLVFLRMFKQV